MKMFVELIQTLTIIQPQHVYFTEAVNCNVYYQNKDSTAGTAKWESLKGFRLSIVLTGQLSKHDHLKMRKMKGMCTSTC